jgi:plasmid segregation protein ParM
MNRQPKLLGLDIGFGFTKCVDGEQSIVFPSSIRRGFSPPDSAGRPAEGGYDIATQDGDFRVGDDTGGPSLLSDFARRPERLLDTFGSHLALTALAAFSEQECPLHLVIGLPLSLTPHWEGPLTKRLTGYHKIDIYQDDGQCVRKNIHIRKVRIVPHPLGTFATLIMNAKGYLRASPYRKSKVALVDIGFRTTDVMVMTTMRFSNRGSATIDLGIADGIEAIAAKLCQTTPALPDLRRLLNAIRRGFIRVEDQEYNLQALRETTYRWLAAAMADRINALLREDWDVESVLLTGGGAADLAEDLAPLVNGEVTLIEHHQDPRLSNADGQLRLARHGWGTTGFCGNDHST